jgi:large subunit ribosomal protein L33
MNMVTTLVLRAPSRHRTITPSFAPAAARRGVRGLSPAARGNTAGVGCVEPPQRKITYRGRGDVDRTEVRPVAGLRPTAGTTHVTRENRRDDPERRVLREYDAAVRGHIDFHEER